MKTEKKLVKVYFNGSLVCGAFIYGAYVEVPEDYTMRQFVNAVKEAGYKTFMKDGMRRCASVS